MSFKIDSGLFKHDFIDHHAVLGVAVDADAKEIRKRYLKIARHLHPDSFSGVSDDQKKLANELLSKLVNPAYEQLFQDKNRAEYMIILSQMGKRMAQDSSTVQLSTELSRQVAGMPNVDDAYKGAIAKLAKTQYDSLSQVEQTIAQISELNAVYLMRTAGKKTAQSAPPPPPPEKTPPRDKTPSPPKEESAIVQYLRRAQELVAKNQVAAARVELQEALKLEPNNSHCHSLIGVVYLKQNQIKMAKVHFDRTLQLDPLDQIASEGKRKIDRILGAKPSGTKPTAKSTAGGQQPNKSGGSGLFGGLFGGKKK